MTDLTAFKRYRRAKVILKDLETVSEILKITTIDVQKYRKYIPVNNILKTITENQKNLNYFTAKYRNIVKNRGKLEE